MGRTQARGRAGRGVRGCFEQVEKPSRRSAAISYTSPTGTPTQQRFLHTFRENERTARRAYGGLTNQQLISRGYAGARTHMVCWAKGLFWSWEDSGLSFKHISISVSCVDFAFFVIMVKHALFGLPLSLTIAFFAKMRNRLVVASNSQGIPSRGHRMRPNE
ncbi:hypothetical protein B0T09DRAFT_174034 [Sordaria sp. MPI-SDFR-AT-0083]|nr:hypothetical protein B0T09DRAFT_174034 [Sordaria sp. MPI-SDFR-AT-0083]